MAKYHINPATGDTSACRAVKGRCPFGGEDGSENHFSTKAEAQAHSAATLEAYYAPYTGGSNSEAVQAALDSSGSIEFKRKALQHYVDVHQEELTDIFEANGVESDDESAFDLIQDASPKTLETALALAEDWRAKGIYENPGDLVLCLKEASDEELLTRMQAAYAPTVAAPKAPKMTAEDIDDVYGSDPAKAATMRRELGL